MPVGAVREVVGSSAPPSQAMRAKSISAAAAIPGKWRRVLEFYGGCSLQVLSNLPTSAGQVFADLAFRLGGRLDVSRLRHRRQNLQDFPVALMDRPAQSRVPEAICRVNVGPGLDENSNQLRVAFGNCNMECRVAENVLCVNICSGFDENSDQLRVAFGNCNMECRVAENVLCVNIRPPSMSTSIASPSAFAMAA